MNADSDFKLKCFETGEDEYVMSFAMFSWLKSLGFGAFFNPRRFLGVLG